MINVLLVDDEPLMRVALNSMIEWETYGFEVCGTASNGEEALHLIEQLNPDIVITDLKMPKMDGIELIQQINIHHFHCKILVVSNYSDYELVRQALTLGAVDYLLKINMRQEDLLNQLNSIKQSIFENKSHIQQQNLQTKNLNENLKKSILRDFFNGNYNQITELSNGIDFTFHHSNDKSFLCYIVPSQSCQKPLIEIQSLKKIISEFLSHITNLELFSLNCESIVVLIPTQTTSIEEVIHQLQRALKTYVTSEYIICYVDSFTGYVEAREKLQLCKSALTIQFYKNQTIINANKINFRHYLDFMPYRTLGDSIIEQCQNNGYKPADRLLNDFINMCQENLVHPEILKQYLCKTFEYLLIQISSLTNEQREQVSLIIEQIPETPDINLLILMIQRIIPLIFTTSNIKEDVLTVLEYINKNYTNKITLSSVASHVHLNESYLCRIFKEEMNTSIISYVNVMRMEKAAQLIKHKHLSINQVCETLNIDSLPYFYRLFKKHFGVSPAKFISMNTPSQRS